MTGLEPRIKTFDGQSEIYKIMMIVFDQNELRQLQNQLNQLILQKTSLPVMTVEELHQKAQKLAGVAEKTILGDRVCGLVEYRDGTIIDVVYDLP